MLELPSEPEIMHARRSFRDAQAALDGGAIETLPGPTRAAPWTCGWYGSSISGERGSFALVNKGGPLDPLLIGDRLRLTFGRRSVVVYCYSAENLDWDIHITRRSFAALEFLAVERIGVAIEVLSG